MTKFKPDVSGVCDFIKAARWTGASFHNSWLMNMPEIADKQQLIKEQGKDIGYWKELCIDYRKSESEMRWAGIIKRTSKDGIYLKSGLRSG